MTTKKIKTQSNNSVFIPRNDISVYRSYTVEVPLNNLTAGSKNPFLLNEFLQAEATGSVIYTGMETWVETQMTFSDSGRQIITQAEAANLSISLIWGQKELLYLSPYLSYNSALNYGTVRRLKNLRFSLSDSQVYVMQTGAIAAGKSALFTFYFEPVTPGR